MDLGFDVVVTITGIVLVFLILVLLMAIITLEGKIFDSMNAKKKAAKTAAQAPAAKPAAAPVQQAAALDLPALVEIGLLGAAGNMLLQFLGGALADGDAVFVANMLEDLLIVVVTGHAHTGGLDLAAKAQHGDIRGAAADINDHAAVRQSDVDAGAEGSGNGLIDQVHLTGASGHHSLHHGIDITQPEGRMIIDIGGGTTDIAVLSLGGKVKATSVRVAGNHYDEEILKFVRNKFSIAIGQRTAENLKKNVACCPQKADFNETMEIKGRSLLTGLPVRVNVSTADLYEPVMRLSEQIGTAAHQVLEKTPPELAGDIYRNGVMLTGGGAQLHGLTEYLSQELKVEVTVSPDPVNCVALGTAQSLSIGDKLETGFTDATPRIGRR